MSESLVLFDNAFSPYAFKLRATLYEKGIDFEKHEIHTNAQLQELKRLNPRAEVPALVDGETVLFDSKVIAEYLEETHAEPPLLPKDATARAHCRALELLADDEHRHRFSALQMLGLSHRELGDLETAHEHASAAAELAPRVGSLLMAKLLRLRARIAAAKSAAFFAPGRPIAKVATGMPPGIWTVASSASRPCAVAGACFAATISIPIASSRHVS